MADSTGHSLLLVLHDVAPETWPDYESFVRDVDELDNVPMTWLVVPNFHKRNPLTAATALQRVLQRRLVRGDELALHGYFHCDDAPPPRTPRDYFMRRIYTWEGEFYGLERDQALTRLEAGIELFARLDWPLHGFVAPAWLMSAGTREALRQLPLTYTSDTRRLYRLPDFIPLDAPGLVWSAGSAWRRGLSSVCNQVRERQLHAAPVIRLGLHPADMRHELSRSYWLGLIERLLKDGREPMTKIAWLRAHASVSEAGSRWAH